MVWVVASSSSSSPVRLDPWEYILRRSVLFTGGGDTLFSTPPTSSAPMRPRMRPTSGVAFVVASNTGYTVSLHVVAFFLNVVDVAFFVFMFVVLCCCKKWCVVKMGERRKGSAKGNLISTTTSICRRSHSRGRATATTAAASAVAYITDLFDALQGRRFAFVNI